VHFFAYLRMQHEILGILTSFACTGYPAAREYAVQWL
jgi:hypothetical protein